MGNILKSNKVSSKLKNTSSNKRVIHKAKVLTPKDVQNNRSMAYTYLSF